MRKFVLLTAAAVATLASAAPALAAEASATANAKGIVLRSLTLTASSDLDFGTVAGDKLVAGTVSINPNTGARTVAGGVVALSGTFGRAQFDGLGDKNQVVTLSLTQPAGGVICTASCAASIPATLMLNAGGNSRTTDNAGKFSAFVGGDFAIAADQQQGTYAATFDLTVNY